MKVNNAIKSHRAAGSLGSPRCPRGGLRSISVGVARDQVLSCRSFCGAFPLVLVHRAFPARSWVFDPGLLLGDQALHELGPFLLVGLAPKEPYLTSVKRQATVSWVKIRNFVHKGLKRLYAEDSAKGVPPHTVDKLRKMLAFLDDMQDPEELRALPAWKVHTLAGDRKGTWSLSVTGNPRLTFRIDIAEREICDLNLEDYH